MAQDTLPQSPGPAHVRLRPLITLALITQQSWYLVEGRGFYAPQNMTCGRTADTFREQNPSQALPSTSLSSLPQRVKQSLTQR